MTQDNLAYVGISPKEYEVTIDDHGRIAHMRVSADWLRENDVNSIVPYVDGETFGMGRFISYRPVRERVMG